MTKILVVDDRASNRLYLVTLLTYGGNEVLQASDGKEALEVVRAVHPDLVITDILMPTMDGHEFARAIRSDPAVARTPIIFYSATYREKEARALARSAGVDHVVPKPSEPQVILDAVGVALHERPWKASERTARLPDTGPLRALSAKLSEKVGELDSVTLRLTALVDLSLQLASERGLERLVEEFCRSARDLLSARFAGISLFDPETGSPGELYVNGLAAGTVRRPGDVAAAIGGNGRLRSTRPLRLAEIDPRPEAWGLPAGSRPFQSFLAFPIARQENQFGTLYFVDKVGAAIFSDDDERVGATLAAQLAVAYENAVLYDEIQRRATELQLEIAEKNRAQSDLAASEQRFRALIENSTDSVTLVGPDGTILYTSPATTRILGYSVDEYVGQNAFALIHPDDAQSAGGQFDQILAHPGAAITVQARERHKDGSWRWLEGVATNLLDEPSIQAIVVNFRDVSERKAADAAFAQTHDLLMRAERIGVIGSWEWDIAADRVVWSDGLYRLFGLKPGEFDGTYAGYLARVHPEDRERVRLVVEAAYLEREAFEFESRIVRLDGETRVLSTRGDVILDSEGTPVRLLGIAMDTTERKHVEEAVAASEAELRSLFAAMTDVVLVLSATGEYLQIAPTNPSLLLRPPVELLGRSIHDVLPNPGADAILGTIQRALELREPIPAEYSLDLGGKQIWFDATVSPFGENRVIWIARDITERKQRERELEAIVTVSVALRAANTKAEVVPILLEQVSSLLGTGAASVALEDLETNDLVVELADGEMAGLVGLRVPGGLGIGGRVMATGSPYTTVDALADPIIFHPDWIQEARAVACVPLLSQEHALGVLWAGRNAAFTGEEVRVLGAIANMGANAIQRAELYEQTEQRVQRLAALREIDSAIMNSLDLRLTLAILLGQVTAQLGVDAADVLVLDRGMNTLQFTSGTGFRTRGIESSRVRIGEGQAGRAAFERRVVVVPHLPSTTEFHRAALLRGEDFSTLVVAPLVSKGKVLGVLEVFHRAPLNPSSDWLGFLETLAGQAAIAISDSWLFEDLQRSNLEMAMAYDTTLEGWSAALDLRDKETEGHSKRVTEKTVELARALGVSDEDLVHIRRGALLHDIGKMGVPDAILLKPGELSEDEWTVMRRHPTYAFELLSPIAFLRPALDIPHAHHEKWDGSGYPRGLRGEAIPLAARIFAVVDVWDALTSERPYRKAWSPQKAREHIRDQAGKHFDPRVVEAFLRMDVGKAR